MVCLIPDRLQADLLPLTGKSKVNDNDRFGMGQECSYKERQHPKRTVCVCVLGEGLPRMCVCVCVLGEGLPSAPKSFHL